MRMKCIGSSATVGYERLQNQRDYVSLDSEVQVTFYNDDGSYQSTIIEKKLRADNLCQILAMKNGMARNQCWSIIEHWVDIGLERVIEDHEDIWEAYKSMLYYPHPTEKRFIFRKNQSKHDMFMQPQKYFPPDMVDTNGFPGIVPDDTNASLTALQHMVEFGPDCLPVFSHVWIRDPDTQLWTKAYLLLKDKMLYLSDKVQIIADLLRRHRRTFRVPRTSTSSDTSDDDAQSTTFEEKENKEEDYHRQDQEVHLLARIKDCIIYSSLNARKHLRAPTQFGICIRYPNFDSDSNVLADVTFGLICIACETERDRICWLAAMRLSKYGKHLRESYRSLKNKPTSPGSPEYVRCSLPNESIRSRVAMDFTGNVGRIVEDPNEAKAILESEGVTCRAKVRPHAMAIPEGMENGVHETQPWFHGKLSRDQATALINKHGSIDGVFLVRESRSNPGIFVLTFRCGGKIIHSQIQPILDTMRETLCFSLDSGVTKFYDLLQLIEFYQLNVGCLPTRLSHYIVNGHRASIGTGNGISVAGKGKSQKLDSILRRNRPVCTCIRYSCPTCIAANDSSASNNTSTVSSANTSNASSAVSL